MNRNINGSLSALLGAILALIIILGCGGAKGTGQSGGTTGGDGQFKPGVVQVPETVTATFSDSTLTLSAPVPGMAVGSVVINPSGQTPILKVLSIDNNRAQGVAAEVALASLEDVYDRVNETSSKSYGSPDWTWSDVNPEVEITTDDGGRALTLPRLNFNILLHQSGPATVRAVGHLDVDLHAEYRLEIVGGKVSHFRLVPYLTTRGEIKIVGDVNVNLNKRILLARGSVPFHTFIPSVLAVDLYADFGGSVSGQFEVSGHPGATLGAGFEWKNNDWHLVTLKELAFDLAPLKMPSASATVSFTPIQAEAKLLVAGVAGPHVTLNVPRVTASLATSANPRGVQLRADARFTASGGVSVEVLGKSLLNRDFGTFYDQQVAIADKFFPFPDGGGGGGGGGGDTRQRVQVDNSDAGFSKSGPSEYWHVATGYGIFGSMLWTLNNTSDIGIQNVAKWQPQLEPGLYEVRVYIPRNFANTADARYEIWINGAKVATRSVNQAVYFDEWVSIGTYTFAGNGNDFIRLGDVTSDPVKWTKWIGVDAIEFIPR
jgi:hypothetical protein